MSLLLTLTLALSPTAHAAAPSLDAPLLQAGSPQVSAGVDAGRVQALAQGRLDAVSRCYRKALAADPSRFGQVAVRLSVQADGSVSASEVAGETLGDADAARCIAGVMGAVQLPAPGAEATVVQPFTMAPAPLTLLRGRLKKNLQACAAGVPAELASQADADPAWSDPELEVLARVDVSGGRALAIQLRHLAVLPPETVGCLSQALDLGPHQVGTAARYYRVSLSR